MRMVVARAGYFFPILVEYTGLVHPHPSQL